jgi:hypothetical protein
MEKRERLQAVSVKNISHSLWNEAKAQAKLQGMTIYQWLTEAIQGHLLCENVLKSRVTITKCERCGLEFDKNHKRIIHHDEPNCRHASVAMVLCYKCHKERHKELGWGFTGRGQLFKCALCQKYLKLNSLDPNPWVLRDTGKKVKLCNWCATRERETVVKYYQIDSK